LEAVMTQAETDDLEVLSAEEAAARLKISLTTVRRLLREGALPGRKVGREWRIRRLDLANFLKSEPQPVSKS
jgi:excisionase family DNA binding protein